MSDVVIFIMGCLVSIVVLSAVGLLFWGAANEPRGGLVPQAEPKRTVARPAPSVSVQPVSAARATSTSPA